MITDGSSRSNKGGYFDWELDDNVANEKNELIACEGIFPGTSKEMLSDLKSLAFGFKGSNYLYHFIQNNKGDRNLTLDEELEASRKARVAVGLGDMPYFIKRHTHHDGSAHTHTITVRVKNGRAVGSDSNDAYKLYNVSREIENAFGLRSIEAVAKRPLSARRRTRWQTMHAGDNGINLDNLETKLKSLIETCESGVTFVEKLGAMQLILARGDRVAFMIVDPAGGCHSLHRQLGTTQINIAKRLKGLDPETLPSLREARARQSIVRNQTYTDSLRPLWQASRSPHDLIAHVADLGFVTAKAKKRGVFLCVAPNGDYLSLKRAVGVGKTAFDRFMRPIPHHSLPDLQQARALQFSKFTAVAASATPASQPPGGAMSVATVRPNGSRTPILVQLAQRAKIPVAPSAVRPLSAQGHFSPNVRGEQPLPDLGKMPDRKARAIVSSKHHPSNRAQAIVDGYKARIDNASNYAPDLVAELERSRDNEVDFALQEQNEAQREDYRQLEDAAAYNASLERDEADEQGLLMRENSARLKRIKDDTFTIKTQNSRKLKSFRPGM